MNPDETKWESLTCPICKRDEISFQEESIKKHGRENLLCWDCAMDEIARHKLLLKDAGEMMAKHQWPVVAVRAGIKCCPECGAVNDSHNKNHFDHCALAALLERIEKERK
jgi:hypothetical protein